MNPEATHPREEEAIAYAFGFMDEAARPTFEIAMKSDAALRALVADLQGTTAGLAFDAPQQAAPADLRGIILSSVATMPQERVVKAPAIAVKSAGSSTSARWLAAAASIGLIGVYVAKDGQLQSEKQARLTAENTLKGQIEAVQKDMAEMKSQLETAVANAASAKQTFEQQLADSSRAAETLKQELAQRTKLETDLKAELARLTKTNELNRVQIATLQSTVAEYKQGVAVVVWNSDTQQGILKLEKMPPVEQGKDYQLWVVDPAKKTPVNAGVVQVDDKGFAKVEFKPVAEISKANNFAISVEKKGGVAENEGPIILLSP